MYTIIIPARLESTRLPNKVLLDINKKPMLQRVYEQCLLTKASRIIIASDNPKVQQLCIKMGCEYVETSTEHTNGTSRVAEVTQKLHIHPRDVVVNVQADEPFINPENIDLVASILLDDVSATFYKAGTSGIATLSFQTTNSSIIDNPNRVKVVTDKHNQAIYFSRSRIPFKKQGVDSNSPYSIHLGIYAYRVAYLQAYVALPECELEHIEGLEQLRAIYHSHGIVVGEAKECSPIHGIDTASDLLIARTYAIGLES
jgi:3-deoxy-manno-octulosonate cytidylyltransferase (CMP-KDO synthetase)